MNDRTQNEGSLSYLFLISVGKTGTNRYNVLKRMGIYFPIKLQNVASLGNCNLILLLQALEILIIVLGHYYSLSNKD